MLEQARERTGRFRGSLSARALPVAVIAEESSIAYLAGVWGYLGMEFGRPSFLVVHADRPPMLVVPLMEREMVSAMTWVEDVRTWEDAGPNTWTRVLAEALGHPPPARIGVEEAALPWAVRAQLERALEGVVLEDVAPELAAMRVVKSPVELEAMRQAGAVAAAMMDAALDAIRARVPEYEVALAAVGAGTRKAAQFLSAEGWEGFVSPVVHALPILQSGRHTAMVHRRASVKAIASGDPVYLCFCNMAEFKHYRIGFDRQFFVGRAGDEALQAWRTAVAAQGAALAAIRPGVSAEDVANAANEVYRSAGFAPGYRTGRSIGLAHLEGPELRPGDRTVLRAGMTFAVDGGVTIPGLAGGRVGDSIVVTETGFDFLTVYPRDLVVL